MKNIKMDRYFICILFYKQKATSRPCR